MTHIAIPAQWRRLVFIYAPISYFALKGVLFESYRLAAWLLRLLGVD